MRRGYVVGVGQFGSHWGQIGVGCVGHHISKWVCGVRVGVCGGSYMSGMFGKEKGVGGVVSGREDIMGWGYVVGVGQVGQGVKLGLRIEVKRVVVGQGGYLSLAWQIVLGRGLCGRAGKAWGLASHTNVSTCAKSFHQGLCQIPPHLHRWWFHRFWSADGWHGLWGQLWFDPLCFSPAFVGVGEPFLPDW